MQDQLNGLIARQGDRVYRMAFSICPNEADDVWQEVFPQWLRKQPEFPNEELGKQFFVEATYGGTVFSEERLRTWIADAERQN